MIDLCSADGMCKYLFKDLEGNGKKYFDKREFCHVVIVRSKLRTCNSKSCTLNIAITISDEENEKYQFCPILPRLQDDHHFMSEY